MRKFIVYSLGLAGVFAFGGISTASAAVHPAGTNIRDNNGTVYMVAKDGTRRPYTSAGAFLSYGFNNWPSVQAATAEDLSLPVGSFIPPQDGSLICSDRGFDKGTCYIITESRKAGFVSESAFTGSGYRFSNVLYGDVSWMSSTTPVSGPHEAHRPGTLIQNNSLVQLVIPGGLMGISTEQAFYSWGYSYSKVVPALPADGALPQVRTMPQRMAGDLHPLDASIANGNGYREGWLEGAQGPSESYGSQGYISGWAYDNDGPVYVTVTLENVNNPSQTVMLHANIDEVRTDVATYLNAKLSRSINNHVGFHAYIPQNTPAGTYRIKSATYNGYSFSVRNEANNTLSVGQNHKLMVLSPNGGETLTLGSQAIITWSDVNGDNAPTETYTIFITREDGGGSSIAGTAYNTNQFTWTVGSVTTDHAFTLSPNSGYYIQIVKQYAVGEGTWDQSNGAFTIK